VPAPELVAREPEVVSGLEVVSRGGLAVAGCPAGHEVGREVRDRRLGRDDRRDRVQRDAER
jgi:hypothetical protein